MVCSHDFVCVAVCVCTLVIVSFFFNKFLFCLDDFKLPGVGNGYKAMGSGAVGVQSTSLVWALAFVACAAVLDLLENTVERAPSVCAQEEAGMCVCVYMQRQASHNVPSTPLT